MFIDKISDHFDVAVESIEMQPEFSAFMGL